MPSFTQVCFYGVRAAPLLGWVLGAAAGAALACWVWRAAWRRRRAAAAAAAARGLPAPYDGYALRQPLLLPRQADWLEELKAGIGLGSSSGGGGGGYEAEAADGGADGADASAAEEGYGGGSDACAPGIEPMLEALGYHGGSTGSVGRTAAAAYGAEGGGAGGGGGGPAALRVHYGRPDPDAYIQVRVHVGRNAQRRGPRACGREAQRRRHRACSRKHQGESPVHVCEWCV